MKTRKRITVPSMIRPTHAFTARERQAFIEWQKPDDAAPAGWLTGHEAGLVGLQVVQEAVLGLSQHAMMHSTELAAPRKERLKVGKMFSPALLAMMFATAVVIDDNMGSTVTRDQLEELMDAVETCWSDPAPPESWELEGIDVAKLVAHVRRVTAEVLARRGDAPETLDERYRLMFHQGGRNAADHTLAVLRSKGALGTLRVTKGTTHVVDRQSYERLMRGLGHPFYCSDPYCAGEATHYAWDDIAEFAEDGRIAVHVRRQERRDGKWVTAVAACGKPSCIKELIEGVDTEKGYIVVESEAAS